MSTKYDWELQDIVRTCSLNMIGNGKILYALNVDRCRYPNPLITWFRLSGNILYYISEYGVHLNDVASKVYTIQATLHDHEYTSLIIPQLQVTTLANKRAYLQVFTLGV